MSLRYDPAKKIARDKRKAMIAGVEYVEPKHPYSSLSRGKKQHEGTVEARQNYLKRTPMKAKGKRGKENDATHRQDRKVMLETSEGRCAHCRRPGLVDLHHVLPKSHYPEFRNDPNNHAALCRPCHEWAEANRIDGWEWFWQTFPFKATMINLRAHLDLAIARVEAMKR